MGTVNCARSWSLTIRKKWYMHNPESVQENETQKLLWDFQISARPPNLIVINKKKKKKKKELAQLWTLLSRRTIEWNKKNVKIIPISTSTFLRKLKKLWNIKVTIIPIVIGALVTVTKGLVISTRTGNKRTSGYHPNYCFIEIGQNTEKSPGDLGRLVVTQTPVRNHQLTLVWKTFKREQIMIISEYSK